MSSGPSGNVSDLVDDPVVFGRVCQAITTLMLVAQVQGDADLIARLARGKAGLYRVKWMLGIPEGYERVTPKAAGA